MEKIEVRAGMSIVTKFSLIMAVLVISLGVVLLMVNNSELSGILIENKTRLTGAMLEEQMHESGLQLRMASQSADIVAGVSDLVDYLSRPEPKIQDEKVLKTLVDFSLGRDYSSVYVIDKTGLTILSTDLQFLGKNYGFRKYFQEAVSGRKYEEVVLGSTTHKLGFYFSRPVKNKNGEVLGVLVIKQDVDGVFKGLADSKVRDFANIMLVNRDGVVLYSNRDEFIYKSLGEMTAEAKAEMEKEKRYPGIKIEAINYKEAMDSVLSGKDRFPSVKIFDEEDKKVEWLNVLRIGEFPYYLVTEMDHQNVMMVVNALSKKLAIIFGLLVALVVLIKVGVIRWTLLPLRHLEEYTKKVISGDLGAKVMIKSRDEIEWLASHIQGMVGSLKSYQEGLATEVRQKTEELSKTLEAVEDKNEDLERSKVAMSNVMEDIGDEKKRMLLLAGDLEKFKLAVDNTNEHVIITDADGVILYANKSVERITGFQVDEIIGKKPSLWGRQMPADFYQKLWHKIKIEKKIFVGEVKNKRKSGEVYDASVSISPILNEKGEVVYFVGIERDVTREHELDRMKTEFLSVASHQLRTPLGGMRWNLEMLLEGDYGVLPEEAHQVTKDLYENNLRMIDLVNSLLDVSRIDQGRDFDSPEEVSPNEVFKKIEVELGSLVTGKNLEFVNDFDINLVSLVIDHQKLREVFENVVSNAIKYNKPGGKIWIKTLDQGDKVLIEVKDSGIGINAEDLGKVTERFFRAKNAVKSETEGSGLGLYVVKKFVEGWGGKFRVESVLGKGTTIEIILPKSVKLKNRIIEKDDN